MSVYLLLSISTIATETQFHAFGWFKQPFFKLIYIVEHASAINEPCLAKCSNLMVLDLYVAVPATEPPQVCDYPDWQCVLGVTSSIGQCQVTGFQSIIYSLQLSSIKVSIHSMSIWDKTQCSTPPRNITKRTWPSV